MATLVCKQRAPVLRRYPAQLRAVRATPTLARFTACSLHHASAPRPALPAQARSAPAQHVQRPRRQQPSQTLAWQHVCQQHLRLPELALRTVVCSRRTSSLVHEGMPPHERVGDQLHCALRAALSSNPAIC